MNLLAIALLLILGFQGTAEISTTQTNANRSLEVALITSPANLQPPVDLASELAFRIRFFQRKYRPMLSITRKCGFLNWRRGRV